MQAHAHIDNDNIKSNKITTIITPTRNIIILSTVMISVAVVLMRITMLMAIL